MIAYLYLHYVPHLYLLHIDLLQYCSSMGPLHLYLLINCFDLLASYIYLHLPLLQLASRLHLPGRRLATFLRIRVHCLLYNSLAVYTRPVAKA